MKKAISIVFILYILVCSLAGCNKGQNVEPIDISNTVQCSKKDGRMILTGFEGDHKNILIPDYVNDADVDILSPSFANGKTIESVKLPKQINAFIRQDDGLALCKGSIPNSVGLNNGNTAAVYCEFFNIDSITVNGVSYSKPTTPDQQSPDLSGEWKNTDIIHGVRYTQVYTFNDGKVTCSADAEAFDGTYEIKDSKLLMTLGDVTAEFEFMGDQLICWEHNITLSTKEVEDYAETSDIGWSYIVTPSGYAQLVGYHGTDANVTIPRDIDGYEVNSINSCVADTYDFSELNYTGHGGARFANTFSVLYYDQQTDNYILYNSNASTDGNAVVNLRQKHNWTSTDVNDMSPEAYCRVFGQASITIDGQVYSYAANNLTAEYLVGLWTCGSDQYFKDIAISLYEDGTAEIHHGELGMNNTCDECVLGQYTYSGNQIYITISKGTMILDKLGDYLICWDGNNWTSGQSPWAITLDFQKYTREGEDYLISPFYHISPHLLKDTFTREYNPDDPCYLTFGEDGNAVVTLDYLGWYDKQVQYTMDGNTITITDGATTKILTIDYYWLTDNTTGRSYVPSWIVD